jgi:hypothetical protein
MNRKSQKIRDYFAAHKPCAGSDREGMVSDFLEEYLAYLIFIMVACRWGKKGATK